LSMGSWVAWLKALKRSNNQFSSNTEDNAISHDPSHS
jgi:hypothetical protein